MFHDQLSENLKFDKEDLDSNEKLQFSTEDSIRMHFNEVVKKMNLSP